MDYKNLYHYFSTYNQRHTGVLQHLPCLDKDRENY